MSGGGSAPATGGGQQITTARPLQWLDAFGRPVVGNVIPGLHHLGVPQMADGGVVQRPTLAMVGEGGEPEAIIPLSRLGSMLGGRGGEQSRDTPLVINLDGREIARAVVRHMPTELSTEYGVS